MNALNPTRKFISEVAWMFLFTTVYCLGLTFMARESFWFEAFISIGLVLIAWMGGAIKRHDRRILVLVGIETFYNANVILSKAGLLNGMPKLDQIACYCFAAYFMIQAVGFTRRHIQLKNYLMIPVSLMGSSMVLLSFITNLNTTNAIDEAGRFLMWSQEAPWWAIAAYTTWAVGVLLIDTQALPYVRQVIIHFASIAVSIWSAEFFHVRLLTACHLLLLATIFDFTRPKEPSPILVLPPRWHTFFQARLRKPLQILILLLMLTYSTIAVFETLIQQ